MKKTLWLLLFIIVLFSFAGCDSGGDLQGVKTIKKENIFNQKVDKYYIYFHRLDCADCAESAPTVINYMNVIKEVAGCQQKRPVFAVLLFTEEEKPGSVTYIFREYDGPDGEGKNGTFRVKNISNWEELYIGSTSSLISISNIGGVKVAKFEAEGAEDINTVLTEQLGECYK